MAKQTMIEIATPSRSVRGRLEKLWVEYTTKAQALRIAADILDEHDRRDAVEAFPQKLIAATAARNGHGRGDTHKVRNGKKPPAQLIHGRVLTVFMVEHLDAPKSLEDLQTDLAAAGSPVGPLGSRGLTAPLSSLVRHGHLRQLGKGKASRWKRTPTGVEYAATVRDILESKGKIPKGGYLL